MELHAEEEQRVEDPESAADPRLSERAQAVIAANPHDKVKLIVTYQQPPGHNDEQPVGC